MHGRALVPLLGALAVLAAGCGGGQKATTTTATTTTSAAAPAKSGTVWLCFPGKAPDPCSSSLATTEIHADGSKTVVTPKAPASPPIDCFYVYPTVSNENRGNSDLQIQLAQTFVAQLQASRFSQVCRVYAPMYRQITNRGLTTPSLHPNYLLTYRSVRSAWQDYLAHYNHGRGVVLIGHSQGAYVLKALTKRLIDPSPAQRRLLVSEILLGGQVLAANGPADTGDFKHVPACASAAATGCVIAYSSFDRVPPAHARFGRVASTTTHVLCVNPADPGSSANLPVTALLPTLALNFLGGQAAPDVSTPWVAYPGFYSAQCKRSGTASWLQIDHKSVPGDTRPVVKPMFGAGWGLHGTDVNIALANLVDVVGRQAQAYLKNG
jgi:Protein of unknown function (DUF3089)